MEADAAGADAGRRASARSSARLISDRHGVCSRYYAREKAQDAACRWTPRQRRPSRTSSRCSAACRTKLLYLILLDDACQPLCRTCKPCRGRAEPRRPWTPASCCGLWPRSNASTCGILAHNHPTGPAMPSAEADQPDDADHIMEVTGRRGFYDLGPHHRGGGGRLLDG